MVTLFRALPILIFALFPYFAQAKAIPLESDLEDIYVRYSEHLDKAWTGDGWDYAVPSRHYNETSRNSYNNIRMQATFASFYRFRDDQDSAGKVRQVLVNAFIDLPASQANAITKKGESISTRSFNEAIGIYLALKILEQRKGLFSDEETMFMIQNIRDMYPWVLRAKDTENRAFLGAAYGLAILDSPLLDFSQEEKDEYLEIIRDKIEVGLESVDKNYFYREGKGRKFSAHYHLVSSDMLYFIGDYLGEEKYIDISKKMLKVAHKKYPLRHLSWIGSGRPTGIGLQAVFLKTIGEKFLGNKKWKKFWDLEKNGRGFVDPKNPDRLVWVDQVDKTLNDDYSFANMVELFRNYIDL